MSIRITPASRTALRKAISNHRDWPTVRVRGGYSFSSMTRDDYLAVAAEMGIDAEKIIMDIDGEVKRGNRIAPRDFGRAIIADADDRDADKVIMRERERLASIRAEQEREILETRAMEAGEIPAHDENEEPSGEWDDEANSIGNRIAKAMGAAISALAAQSLDREQIRKLVLSEIKTAMEGDGARVLKIDVMRGDELIGRVEGSQHAQFPNLLRAATARDKDGYAPNVWIAGPAGSGKTHAVSMVAKALEDDFHYNGAIGMQHELLGFVDAGGKYHTTPFRKAYEFGGCYLFDEVDGSDNSALLALNAALANGRASFPDAAIVRHKECRIFASANTWGFGGTADYVGRSKIDAAFLSRFPVRLKFDYDLKMERSISGNAEFAERVQNARAKARTAGLKVLITPRDSIAGAALIAAGMSHDEAAEMTYLAALTDEQRRMIS